jgi:very-short-patch-repair endonuclease
MKHTPYIHNEASQKLLRQSLRNNATSAEAILWRALKGKQVDGLKFRRQFGAGPYVIDFYCPEIRLGIELDGGVHKASYTNEYDEMRTKFLNENRIRILRFDNEVVYNNVEGIIEAIKGARSDHP